MKISTQKLECLIYSKKMQYRNECRHDILEKKKSGKVTMSRTLFDRKVIKIFALNSNKPLQRKLLIELGVELGKLSSGFIQRWRHSNQY